MGRRKGGKRKQHGHIDNAVAEQDTDAIFDEVDVFHNERNKDIDSPKKIKQNKEIEVLSVEVDDNLNNLYDDDDLDKPAEDPLLNVKLTSANQWGKSRKEYYINNHTRTREDGYLNDEEQEILELEEEDATERQKKLDGKNAVLDFDQFFEDENDFETADSKPMERMTLREKMALAAAQRRLEEESNAQLRNKKIEQKSKPVQNIEEDVEEEKEVFVEGWDDYDQNDEVDEGVEKRGINYQIEKNKGLTQKRKKGTEHSRIKRRLQYKKALVKRRSQIPDVKREMQKYTGEARGIRASTVKSIKIKA